MNSFLCQFCHPPILRFILVTLCALAWSSLVFGGEIHDAAAQGDLEKVKALLKANPYLVSSKDSHGMTPLHWAALNGQKDAVELLLANKADVNATSNNGDTPLHLAEAAEHQDVAELLRQHGGQDTTILRAALNGDLEKIKAFLKVNPNLVFSNDPSYFGYTPLHAGCRKRTRGCGGISLGQQG